MRAPGTALALVLLALAGGGCRHAPAKPDQAAQLDQAARPDQAAPPTWPAPPAAPRVRLLASLQVGAVTRPAPAWWRSALDWLAGLEPGPGDDGLARPFDAAIAPDGSILVADPDGPRVVRFAATGGFLADLACAGRAWGAPVSVAAEGDQVFVSDAGAALVVLWSSSGCRLLGAGALERPAGLALAAGLVLVADAPAHQVVALRRDGTVAARWGQRGEGELQFHFPTDLAVAPDGSIFVVDAFNFRVAHLAADGRWLGAFGAPGDRGGEFLRPKGIAAGPGGELYVTDAQRDLVLVFGGDGAFRLEVGAPGSEPGQLSHPAGLDATRDRLAVADSLNRRIQVFEVLGAHP